MSIEVDAESIPEAVDSVKDANKHIPVDVSFRIINQFSTQLYDSPRRAIEELACNSYDAAAEECHISTPKEAGDNLKILDNGESMDYEGLKWLWKVAESRKEHELDNDRTQYGRQQIGKFGVGKLAAFALGNRLTHVATKDGKTRVITVYQDRLKRTEEGEVLDENENPDIPRFGVHEFDQGEAKDLLGDFFDDVPNPWEKGWETWTLAVVGDIPPENTGDGLKPQYLHNMIRTSIPISTKFRTILNGEEISKREPSANVRFEIDVTEDAVITRIEDKLKEALVDYGIYETSEDVPEGDHNVDLTDVVNPEDTSETVPGIHVPYLGDVSGRGKFYDNGLTSDKRSDRGFKDHGFRVRVRGKLLNKNHVRFGLKNLSHRYWIKSLIEVEMPGLDDSIRVQRDDTMDKVEVEAAQVVLRSLFNAIRADGKKYEEIEQDDPTGGIKKPFSERLEMRSRDYAYQSIRGLTEEGQMPADLTEVGIDFTPRGASRNSVDYKSDDSRIRINEEHPLLESLERRDGFNDDIKESISEILAGRLLIQGYQKFHGVDEYILKVSNQIFESVLRGAADTFSDEVAYQMDHLRNTSYEGGTAFEVAIAETLQSMSLSAVQEGGPGASDGIITIPRAGDNFLISVEAKGSGGVVSHKNFNKGDTKRHMKDDNCDHVLIVAREFKLDGTGDKDSAFMRSVEDYESLMTLDGIERLLRLQRERNFSYPQLLEIFTHEKSPGSITDHITEVWREKPEEVKIQTVLEEAHKYMAENTNYPNIGILDNKIDELGYKEIWELLEKVNTFAPGMITFDDVETRFHLEGSPDTILDRMSNPEKSDVSFLDRD